MKTKRNSVGVSSRHKAQLKLLARRYVVPMSSILSVILTDYFRRHFEEQLEKVATAEKERATQK